MAWWDGKTPPVLYHYTEDLRYTHKSKAFPNQRRPDSWLMPPNATLIPVPAFREDEMALFEGGEWVVKLIPIEPSIDEEPND